MSDHDTHHSKFAGPKSWIATTIAGCLVGYLLTFAIPAQQAALHAPSAEHAPHIDPSEEIDDELDEEETTHAVHPTSFSPAGSVEASIEAHGDHVGEHGLEAHGADHGDSAAETHHGELDGHDDHGVHDAEHGSEHGSEHGEGHAGPEIPIVLVAPFALLLMSIAVMPFISERFWHNHFPDFAFFLGSIVGTYYFFAYDMPYHHGMTYGEHHLMHSGLEYIAFIALVGGLYVASGGIVVDVKGRSNVLANVALLGFGAVLANIIGTTGASVVLIRPFMRMNAGRLTPMHVVFFIFIVSNCGGALTPIGDPPLYLGFIKGVPFEWTLIHLWPMWAACIGMLLAAFAAFDTYAGRKAAAHLEPTTEKLKLGIRGTSGMIALALIIGCVFLDPLLEKFTGPVMVPFGAIAQIVIAVTAYLIAPKANLAANEFTFFPIKEVGLLFVGIFVTMMPALGYLATHGESLGIKSTTQFYFATGALSGVLDNAPTYLNFLQVAFGDQDLNKETIAAFIETDRGVSLLSAISLGAVFFGAMSYIGNGPNFMVRAIAEANGLRMPSFFGFSLRAIVVLFPILFIIWLIFLR